MYVTTISLQITDVRSCCCFRTRKDPRRLSDSRQHLAESSDTCRGGRSKSTDNLAQRASSALVHAAVAAPSANLQCNAVEIKEGKKKMIVICPPKLQRPAGGTSKVTREWCVGQLLSNTAGCLLDLDEVLHRHLELVLPIISGVVLQILVSSMPYVMTDQCKMLN